MEYKWRVKKSERGMSLENFIYSKLGDWSHSQVKKAIDSKRAFVNGKNVFISKWNLKPNNLVLFVPIQGDLSQTQKNRYRFVEVLFEDQYILVANKPAFVDHEEFAHMIQEYLKRKNKGRGYPYVGQMHRLDKETTGVMVFTKKKIANTLADQFREHRLGKFYLAIVEGCLDKEQGTIKKAIEKGEFEEGRRARIVSPKADGKKAVTNYRVLERYGNATVVKLEILTGRTHQIRLHMSDLGNPLVGDKLYGSQDGISFKRHALHAERLDFVHPITKDKMRILAPLPKDMGELIERLRDSV